MKRELCVQVKIRLDLGCCFRNKICRWIILPTFVFSARYVTPTVIGSPLSEVSKPPDVLYCSPEATNCSSWAAQRSQAKDWQHYAHVSTPQPLLPQVIAINTNVLLFDQSGWINGQIPFRLFGSFTWLGVTSSFMLWAWILHTTTYDVSSSTLCEAEMPR